jgi:hypothetical protein
MTDSLSGTTLMQHIRALADVIGGRPAGKRGEMQARQYVGHALKEAGIDLPVEEIPFRSPDTWLYASLIPGVLTLAGNLLGKRFRWLGGSMSLFSAFALYKATVAQRQPLTFLAPSGESANLVVRIPAASGTARRKVVLVGHLDTNKHRLSFRPEMKSMLRPFASTGIILATLNGIAQLFGLNGLRRVTGFGIALSLPVLLLDELDEFVDGANDNATAVACLLGLGAHLNQNRLRDTEVWLAFTGAEEAGCLGMHALLDKYRVELADAWFIDFEMVGAGKIAYVTEHSSLSLFGAYQPDPESVALAVETARNHPEFGVSGTAITITEEVGALRGRGFRGICLVGVGEDGWLVNWHQNTDIAANIDPACVEKAARFALAMMQTLDERP